MNPTLPSLHRRKAAKDKTDPQAPYTQEALAEFDRLGLDADTLATWWQAGYRIARAAPHQSSPPVFSAYGGKKKDKPVHGLQKRISSGLRNDMAEILAYKAKLNSETTTAQRKPQENNMARPPNPTPPETEVIEMPGLPVAKQAADAQAMADILTLDAADTLQAVGQIQAFQFLATVADSAMAQIYAKIKETKAYKGMPYRDENGRAATVATLEEFCEKVLRKSGRRCRELHENLALLGGELYEAAEQVGFQARDYRALKALPTEDQDAMRQALANDNPDEAMTLLAELVARHKGETEKERGISDALRTEIQGRKADYDALEENYKDQSAELVRFKSGREPPPPPSDQTGKFIASLELAAEQALVHITHMDNMRQGMMDASLEARANGSEEESALFEQAKDRFAGHMDHAIHEIRMALDGARSQLERTFGWAGEATEHKGA